MATSTSRSGKTKFLQKKGVFTCERCNLSTPYHSFGRKHPFSGAIVLLEEAYVARDPFTPDFKPLILGSHCAACNKTVCVAQTCSVFYTKRFCVDCVRSNLSEFPVEIQRECVQGPGDVLYVPENWGHAVGSTWNTVAVAYESSFRVVKDRRLDSMSQGSSGGGSSWHYTAVSVLAGVGAGCVLGVLGARLLWRKRRPSSRSRSRPGRPQQQQQQQPASQESSLVAAIAELTAEVIHLREALRESALERQLTLGGRAAGGGGGGRPSASVASTEFVSAAEDSIASSDEAFYDVTDVAGVVKGSLEYFDRLGKETLSSEEACVNLSQQIQEKLTETPTDVGLLWRLTRATFHLSMQYKNREDKEGERRLLDQAVEYGQQALEVDDSVWQAHQWFAVAIGSVATFEGTQEKIAKGHQYKEHIDTAISLSPNEPVLHYLRGRWCYEVASLSWLEKKAASALYATPPDSSYEEALQSFLKVEELTPDSWKGNLLMVAKCYIKLYDVPSAVEWLYKAYQLPTANSDDVAAQRETEELLLQHDEDFALDG